MSIALASEAAKKELDMSLECKGKVYIRDTNVEVRE
jgi:hypothetical protein